MTEPGRVGELEEALRRVRFHQGRIAAEVEAALAAAGEGEERPLYSEEFKQRWRDAHPDAGSRLPEQEDRE